MSVWKELKKVVNSNFNKTLDVQLSEQAANYKQQLINMAFCNGQLITASTTYTVPTTGVYKIICVGAGENGTNSSNTSYGGASGGVAVEKATLTKGQTYSITISSGNASFGSLCSATKASNRTGGGGTTTNGVVYQGNPAISGGTGADVGFYDAKYMSPPIQTYPTETYDILSVGGTGLFGGQQPIETHDSTGRAASGGGGYGAGGGSKSTSSYTCNGIGGAACVYIELVCAS